MLFSKTIQEKIKEWFNQDLFSKKILQYSDKVEIEEKKKGGEALVYFRSNSKNTFFIKGEESRNKYLKQKGFKIADGIIFVFENDLIASLHIVELKKTVGFDEWSKTKEQFKGALIAAMAIKGILEIKVKGVYLYTAYREDKIKTVDDSAFVLNGQPPSKELNEWTTNIVTLEGSEHRFKHRKIELDKETGFGEIDLTI